MSDLDDAWSDVRDIVVRFAVTSNVGGSLTVEPEYTGYEEDCGPGILDRLSLAAIVEDTLNEKLKP